MAERKKQSGRTRAKSAASGKSKSGTRTGGKKTETAGRGAGSAAETAPVHVRLRDEICAIILIASGAFLIISLQAGGAGQFGLALKTLLMGSFGGMAKLLPYYLIFYAILLFSGKTSLADGRSVLFLAIIFLLLTIMNAGRFVDPDAISFAPRHYSSIFDLGAAGENGGFFGTMIGMLLVKLIGRPGLYILCGVGILVSLLLVINTPLAQMYDRFREKRRERKRIAEARATLAAAEAAEPEEGAGEDGGGRRRKKRVEKAESETEEPHTGLNTVIDGVFASDDMQERKAARRHMRIIDYMNDDTLFEEGQTESAAPPVAGAGSEPGARRTETRGLEPAATSAEDGPAAEPVVNTGLSAPDGEDALEKEGHLSNREASRAMLKKEEISTGKPVPKHYKLPPVDLLKKGPGNESIGRNENLKVKALKLEKTLQDFNVNAKVIQVTMGPAVTRYEIQPSTGVKVNSIVRLADDIALNLEAKSIRIEAPIPGKAAVGIEVENDRVNLVSLRDIVDSREFRGAKSKISFAVGMDISGKSIVADLKSMPHLLIAGSTGSGKSVCINSIIISLLYKARPDEVKLVLIDPKVVELGNYNGIPHLLVPVVTEAGKAAAALNWAVAEMTVRYKKFAELGVRDLASYNDAARKAGEAEAVMPQIVIIIDELADLMMVAPSQVEESICRLAQMARAAGMHLIVATQRPSVDIITGVIKANIPSRIAFAVSSQFDSRTILDMSGAEHLVGKGDMLFNPLGVAKPVRVQGTFVSDSEVHSVIDFVKKQLPEVAYSEDIIQSIEKVQPGSDGSDGEDALLPEAIETVVMAKQASASMLQRRFRIGYNRAARLIEEMEARGIIGPQDGSRPRSVLMREEELASLSEQAAPEQQ